MGWSSSADGEVEWEDQQEIVNLTSENNGIVILYAIWRKDPITVTFHSNWDQYTMTFDANGGVGGWIKRLDVGA